jgi:hypothetical protein
MFVYARRIGLYTDARDLPSIYMQE